MPIYLVILKLTVQVPGQADAGGTHVRRHLVEAPSKAAAEKHVAKHYIGDAQVPAPRELAELAGSGVKLETAGAAS